MYFEFRASDFVLPLTAEELRSEWRDVQRCLAPGGELQTQAATECRSGTTSLPGRCLVHHPDPFSNTFFRLSPAAYRFVARLNGDRTAEAVWKECLALFPDEAPGQREIVRLLGQLTNANLIQSDLPRTPPCSTPGRRK
jgi:hypothetical protein